MRDSDAEIVLQGRGLTRKLSCKVFQSPLSGVSDQVFRRLVRRWAPNALLFTEMVNATSMGLGHGVSKVEEIFDETGPVGVQIYDYRPKSIIKAAIKAEEAGAFLIDINMGCPVKKIAKKGGGSALIKDPELASKIVRDVVKAVEIPVTVKTRLGWDENTSDPISFSRKLEDAGAKLITMHGRTRKQGFSGKANWYAIREIKKALTIPLIANGDINNASDALRCLSITNADGVMIGRASMGSPWLAGQIDAAIKGNPEIPTPEAKEKLGIALEQLKELLTIKGDHGLLIARKHMNWTCKGFSGSSKLRHELIRAKTPSQAIEILENQIYKFSNK